MRAFTGKAGTDAACSPSPMLGRRGRGMRGFSGNVGADAAWEKGLGDEGHHRPQTMASACATLQLLQPRRVAVGIPSL